MSTSAVDDVLQDIRDEVLRAEMKFPAFNSAHEGYAVILEELDELWEEVRRKTRDRDYLKMETESVQVAAMAVRFILNVIWQVPASHAQKQIANE